MTDDEMSEMINLASAVLGEIRLARQEMSAGSRSAKIATSDQRVGSQTANPRLDQLESDMKRINRDLRSAREDRVNDLRKIKELEERVEALESEPV